MKNLAGKVVALTGAGSGIGRALALQLAEKKCHLALADIDETGLEEFRGLDGGEHKRIPACRAFAEVCAEERQQYQRDESDNKAEHCV